MIVTSTTSTWGNLLSTVTSYENLTAPENIHRRHANVWKQNQLTDWLDCSRIKLQKLQEISKRSYTKRLKENDGAENQYHFGGTNLSRRPKVRFSARSDTRSNWERTFKIFAEMKSTFTRQLGVSSWNLGAWMIGILAYRRWIYWKQSRQHLENVNRLWSSSCISNSKFVFQPDQSCHLRLLCMLLNMRGKKYKRGILTWG